MTTWLIPVCETLTELLDARRFDAARSLLVDLEPVDIATLIEELPPEQALPTYRLLPKTAAAETFSYLDSDTQESLLRLLTTREMADVMAGLYDDDAVDLLEELPAGVVKRLMRVVSSEERRTLNRLLRYPEDSAGSVLTTEFVDLKAEMTVAGALRYIRACGPDKETIYTCYVTDGDRHLEGVVTVRDLLLAQEDDRIGDLMNRSVWSVGTTEDRETVAQLFTRYDLIALPVVDSEHRLVGIITVDDVIDILQEEVTEDIEKMAAIIPADKPYLKTGVWTTYRTRIPWLLLLMISATFTGIIITSFESALAASVALTAFIPLLMGTGGNSGSQSSVTLIRVLALDEIRLRDIGRVLWKELRVAVLCGITLAAAVYLKLLIVDRWMLGTAVSNMEALVICLTMAVTVVCAKLLGCTLPLLAKRLGVDPAVMASPFITTIVDVLSLLMLFGTATLLL
ncbi:MAG: magnesium transporter [Clostridia bacterium]|nr:magnesium transporter [Clostridia bacterium]